MKWSGEHDWGDVLASAIGVLVAAVLMFLAVYALAGRL